MSRQTNGVFVLRNQIQLLFCIMHENLSSCCELYVYQCGPSVTLKLSFHNQIMSLTENRDPGV